MAHLRLSLAKKKLAYVRISKSACTSVQAALLGGRFPDTDIGDFSVDQINYLGMNYLKPMLSPDYTCFTVVRDPAERLLSCYHDQYLSRKKKFYYFQDYLFAIIKPDLPIDQFLAIIHKIPDFLKDVHFRPQSAFLKNLSGVNIFKLEDDLDKLRAFLNSYDLSLSHLNRNPVEKLKVQDLSPSSKKLLKTIYRDDYKSFNYPTDF